MKTGFLVEWLEQALTGALEAQKPAAAPRPVRSRFPTARDVEVFGRALGHRDVLARHSACGLEIVADVTCEVGHLFTAKVDQFDIWSRSSKQEQGERVVLALTCPHCLATLRL